MSTTSGTGNTAPGLTAATVLLFVWAFLTYLVRIYVRRKSFGPDDVAVSLSVLFILGNLVAVCYAVHRGYGTPWQFVSETDNDAIRHSLYAYQLLYVIGIGTARVSANLFAARFLTRDQSHERVAKGFLAACGIWTFGSFLVVALRSPFGTPWETLDGTSSMFVRWLVIEAAGVLIDLCATVWVAYLVWTLNMSFKKRLAACAIFSCRLLVVPLIILRLVFLHPSSASNFDIVTQAVLNGTFILTSVTCLKPFLRPFHTGYTITTVDASQNTSGWIKPSKTQDSSRGTFYELNETQSSGDSKPPGKSIVSVQTREREDEWNDEQTLIQSNVEHGLVLRPDHTLKRSTTVTGGARNSGGRELPGRESILVSRTMNVMYE